jgi:hypothetical protein
MKRKEKVYYPLTSQAPYFSRDEADARAAFALQGNYTTASASSYALLPLRRVTSVQSTLARTAEADAAAGGGVLPRVASTPHVGAQQHAHDGSSRHRRATSAGLRVAAQSVPSATNATTNTVPSNNNTAGAPESADAASSAALRQEEKPDAATTGTTTKSKGMEPTAAHTGREMHSRRDDATTIRPDWRLRVRMRTTGIGLVLCLNIGTDPPDLVKPHPCAVLQGWMDPTTVSRQKAKEWIGERLEQQYAAWQLARTARPLRYRRAADPTVDVSFIFAKKPKTPTLSWVFRGLH